MREAFLKKIAQIAKEMEAIAEKEKREGDTNRSGFKTAPISFVGSPGSEPEEPMSPGQLAMRRAF
jgi:hypothetical protein